MGQPLKYTGFEIVWNAPASVLPQAFWVYRVLPSEFTPATVSNLMALASFTVKDRTPTLGRRINDPRMMCFANQTRALGIYPQLGFVEYRDRIADRPTATEGVPGKNEASRLATNYLRNLGIDLAQLSPDVRFRSATGYLSKPNLPVMTNVHNSSVSFTRRVDGVDFFPPGLSCFIEFGHHAGISQISLSWRNLERDRSHPAFTPEIITKMMREGKCFAQRVPPDYNNFLDSASVRKVVVRKMTIYYYAEDKDVSQDWVYPFAYLETSVDIARTNFVVMSAPGKSISFDPRKGLTNNPNIRAENASQTNATVYMCCPIIDERQ